MTFGFFWILDMTVGFFWISNRNLTKSWILDTSFCCFGFPHSFLASQPPISSQYLHDKSRYKLIPTFYYFMDFLDFMLYLSGHEFLLHLYILMLWYCIHIVKNLTIYTLTTIYIMGDRLMYRTIFILTL